jgi:excisionase family DNA binding protein
MTPPGRSNSVEPLLTVEDVAARLQLSVRSIRRLIAENKLCVIRIGRSVRVRPEDLTSFVDHAASSGQLMTE